MPPERGPAVHRRRLGAELRRLREEAGLLIEDVAEVLECSASKISRLETGKGIPKTRDVRDMLTHYGVTDQKRRDRLLQWARDGQQQGWWQQFVDVIHHDPITQRLDNYVALETDATNKFEFQVNVVPGLLQTEAYARAVLEALLHDSSPQDIDRLVELRLLRQAVLYRDVNPLTMTCVVEESVLQRPVGGPAAMAEQLERLVNDSSRSNIEIRVLPLNVGAHAAIISSFELLEFDDDRDRGVVILESITGNTNLEGESDLGRYRHAFDAVVAKSYEPPQSLAVMKKALAEMRAEGDSGGG